MKLEHSIVETVAAAIERCGWSIVAPFFTAEEIAALARECAAFENSGTLTAAGVGRRRELSGLRGDRTRWFEPETLTPAQAAYWSRMDALRIALNRRLLLGLDVLEAHYALYPPGAGYARHRDRFRDDTARVLSSVVYLNPDWQSNDGGALRLYLTNDDTYDVAPLGGTLVLFLSAEIEHEVLPAMRDRRSVAGWFRRR